MQLFGDALAETFPKILRSVHYSKDPKAIAQLMLNLQKRNNNFETNLWWFRGNTHNPIRDLCQLNQNTWLMDFQEIRIRSIWTYFDTSLYTDFILLNLDAMPSFGIYDTASEYEEVGLIDNEFYITRNEYDNGYAEINNNIIKLSEHDVRLRCRNLKSRIIFIITQFHNIFCCESIVQDFLKSIESSDEEITKEKLDLLIQQIGKHKHPLICKNS